MMNGGHSNDSPRNRRSRQYAGVPNIDDDDYDDDDDGDNDYPPHNNNRNNSNRAAGDIAPFYLTNQAPTSLRGDGYGGGGMLKYSPLAPTRDNGIQSHNYEPDESEVWRAYVAQVHFSNRGHWWTTGKKRALKRWVLTFAIGVVQALVATLCNLLSKKLTLKKFDHVYELLAETFHHQSSGSSSSSSLAADTVVSTDDLFQTDDATHGGSGNSDTGNSHYWSGSSAFLVFVFYQTLYAAIASLFVMWEPVSAGSGIPEVKCFLNGIDLPRIVRVKTLLCKVVGVAFSVAAGLPVGKEGPMVHSGAVVASGISQGKTTFWGVDTSFSKFSDFRNDREKRDFVACGAAAGVASAFGAPIGGVLFSLEEGASYWSTKLTWRAFFCAMTTLATLFAIRNFRSGLGQADIDKLFSFGEFTILG